MFGFQSDARTMQQVPAVVQVRLVPILQPCCIGGLSGVRYPSWKAVLIEGHPVRLATQTVYKKHST